MRITAALLREHGACKSPVAIFEAEWPQGVEVTETSLLRAAGLGLDLSWFALHFLSDPLWKGYKRRQALLQAEYERRQALLIWRLISRGEEEKP